MTSRLLIGIATIGVAGLLWISGGTRETAPAPASDAQAERARAATPLTPSPSTPARSAMRGGGLPARDTSARRSSSRGGAPRRVAPQAASRPSAPAPHRTEQPSTNSMLPSRERAVAPRSTDAAYVPAAAASLSDARDGDRPRSQGIGGSVLEKGGSPAAGVAIALKPRRIFSGGPSAPQNTVTDGRGGFTFGAVPDGEYEIRTEKNDRYESAFALVRAGTDAAVLVVEPASQNAMVIRGVVESSGGGALPGVRVEAIGRSSVNTATDARGAYTLRVPADARVEQTALRFKHDGYQERRWTIADGQRSSDYEVVGNVRLEPDAAGLSITGVVTSTAGTPVARAQVQLNSATRSRGHRAVTDAAGRFTLTKVESGTDYRLWVRPQSGYKDGVLENVVVDAATELSIELTPIGLATLKGRIVSPDGQPVPGFTMSLATANAAASRTRSITTDSQGRFLVADLPEGRAALQTHAAPALSVSGIELSAGAPDTDLAIVVDVGSHRFDGRLVTNDGQPAGGVTVALEWSSTTGAITSRSTRQTITDAEGNFAFTQLGSGTHIVSAALPGAGSVRVQHVVGTAAGPVEIALPGKRGRQ